MLFAESRDGGDRPWMMFNMVASVDGATAVEGSATPLNDPDDKALFHALRTLPDMILVGAETVRAEDYGPARLDDDEIARRREKALDDLPRLVVATRSADLDPSARLFSDPANRPLVVTSTDADSSRVEVLAEVAEVAQLEDLSPSGILERLDDADVILCEGGPTLNAALLHEGLVDELFLSLAPKLAGGSHPLTAVAGVPLPEPAELRLVSALRGQSSLFLRYRVLHEGLQS